VRAAEDAWGMGGVCARRWVAEDARGMGGVCARRWVASRQIVHRGGGPQYIQTQAVTAARTIGDGAAKGLTVGARERRICRGTLYSSSVLPTAALGCT